MPQLSNLQDVFVSSLPGLLPEHRDRAFVTLWPAGFRKVFIPADAFDVAIYALLDEGLTVRYVGKAVQHNLDNRLKVHRERKDWARYYFIIERVTFEDWAERERYWIGRYRELGNLVNLAKGGQSGFGRPHSPEVRARLSSSHRGLRHSAESRERISASSKGRPKSDVTRQRIKESWTANPERKQQVAALGTSNRGRKHTDEAKEKMRAARDRRRAQG